MTHRRTRRLAGSFANCSCIVSYEYDDEMSVLVRVPLCAIMCQRLFDQQATMLGNHSDARAEGGQIVRLLQNPSGVQESIQNSGVRMRIERCS